MDFTVVWQAWADALGADPDVFGTDVTVLLDRPDWTSVVVVELGQGCVVAGPTAAVHAISRVDRDLVTDAGALAGHLGRSMPCTPIGTADLWFTDTPSGLSTIGTAEAGEADAAAVRTDCSADEVDESGLDDLVRLWVARTAAGRPAAVAGYGPWAERLAQLGVLTRKPRRGQGFAQRAAARAVEAAVESGLVAQWRCRVGNESSSRLAQRLGLTWAGRQAAVTLTP